jgi:hypothetical protein
MAEQLAPRRDGRLTRDADEHLQETADDKIMAPTRDQQLAKHLIEEVLKIGPRSYHTELALMITARGRNPTLDQDAQDGF